MNKFLLLILIFISGCAAPGHVKDKAKAIMGDGACYNLFNNGQLGSYQHCTHQLGGRCVFALSLDKSNKSIQACGFARGTELLDNMCVINCLPTWAQLESLAIARCEETRLKSNIKSTCSIFARDNNILWGDDRKNDVNFQ